MDHVFQHVYSTVPYCIVLCRIAPNVHLSFEDKVAASDVRLLAPVFGFVHMAHQDHVFAHFSSRPQFGGSNELTHFSYIWILTLIAQVTGLRITDMVP